MRNLLTGVVGLLALFFIYSCQKEVSLEFGSLAQGSLQGDGGDCLPKTLAGSYIAGKALTDSNFLEVTVDVAAAGPYTIVTDTVNGYSFKGTGTFNNTGAKTVRLKGSGVPTGAGVNNFTVVFDSSYCEVAVTVLPAGSTGGPAVFTLVGSPSGCSAFDLTGTYYKDTTLDIRHSVKVNVNVTSPGTYTITTNTVNGYNFTGSGMFGTTGPTQITLQGSGKPAAAGTNNFTVTGSSTTCTFPVTVTASTTNPPPPPPVSTDYFPIAANNWWSYNYSGGGSDTMIMKVTGTSTIGGQTYHKFDWSSPSAGPIGTYYYRKDASNGYYYEGMDTAGFGPEVVFTQNSSLHVNFLRNTLAANQTWNTDYPVNLNVAGFYTGPGTLRFKYTCSNNNATITTPTGRTLTNVYEVISVVQVGISGQFQDVSEPIKTYYARGVGQVRYRDESDPTDIYEETIRYWLLN